MGKSVTKKHRITLVGILVVVVIIVIAATAATVTKQKQETATNSNDAHTMQLSSIGKSTFTKESIYADMKLVHKRYGGNSEQVFAASASNFKIDLSNIRSAYYFGVVAIGTPTRNFELVFDTGNGYTFVPGVDCNKGACLGHNLYESHSAISTKHNVTLTFGSGEINGLLVKDNCTLVASDDSKMTFDNLDLIVSFNETGDALGDSLFDGTFGLGWADSTVTNGYRHPMDLLYESKQISRRVFSFYLNSDSYGSYVSLGGYSTEHVSENISWIPVIEEKRWMVQLSSASIGSFVFNSTSKAMIDSGTSMIAMPYKIATAINKELNATHNPDMPLLEIINCKGNPDFHFVFHDTMLTLTNDMYVISMDSGVCISPFVGTDTISDSWVFGDIFIRAFYSVFDMDNKVIGFGKTIPSSKSQKQKDKQSS